MSRYRGKPASALPVGTHIGLTVRCKNVHLWVMKGEITEQKSINFGSCGGPGAPDDPSCCPECHEPMAGHYGYHLLDEDGNRKPARRRHQRGYSEGAS